VVATRATGRPLHEGEVRKVCMGHMEPVLGGRGGARWAACFGAFKFIIIHNKSQHCAWMPEREEGKTMQARGAGARRVAGAQMQLKHGGSDSSTAASSSMNVMPKGGICSAPQP